MSVKQNSSPMIDYNSILDGVVKSDRLPNRLQHQAENVFHDLDNKLHAMGVDVSVREIAAETEQLIIGFVEDDTTDTDRYLNDTQNLNTLGGALVVVLRQREIPITSQEVTDLINRNGDFESIVERFSDELEADFNTPPDDNIHINTPNRTYQFRVENDRGESAPINEVRDVIGGETTADLDTIKQLSEYISSNTVQNKYVTRTKRKIDSVNGEFTTPASKERFVERYAEVLNIHNETKTQAVTIAGMYPETGRDPSVVAAAALWMAAQEVGEPIRQSDIINEADVSGPGLRKAMKELDLDIEKVIVNTTTNIRPGGVVQVPSIIVEWTGIDGKYIEYPSELDGASVGDKIELDVADEIPDGAELARRDKTIPDGVEKWCSLDHIPLPDEINIKDQLPRHVRWDYDNDSTGDVLYVTVTEMEK